MSTTGLPPSADARVEPVTAPGRPPRRWARRAGIAMAVLAALVGIYAAAGYWGLPALLERKLPEVLETELGRPASVGKVAFDPFALRLTIENLRIGSADETALLAARRATADVAWASLRRLAPVVESLRVEQPVVRVGRERDGRLDIQDILDRQAAKPKQPSGPTPGFVLHDVALVDGRIEFDDRKDGLKHVIDALQLALPWLSSLPADRDTPAVPTLRASIDGAALAVDASVRPFAAEPAGQAKATLSGLDLLRIVKPHLPASVPIRIHGGTGGATLVASWATPAGADARLDIEGGLRIEALDVRDPADGELVRARALVVEGLKLAPLADRYEVGSVVVEAPKVVVRRGADDARFLEPVMKAVDAGQAEPAKAPKREADPAEPRADVSKPAAGSGHAGAAASTPAASPSGPDVRVDRIEIRDGSVDFADERFSPAPLRVAVDQVQFTLTGLTRDEARPMDMALSMQVRDGPTAKATGVIVQAPFKLDTDVTVDGLALQPWWWIAAPQVGFDLADGRLGAKATIHVADKAGTTAVGIDGLAAKLENLLLRERGPGAPEWLSLPALSIADTAIDLDARRVRIGRLDGDGGQLQIRRARDGSLNLASLAAPPSKGPAATKAAPGGAKTASGGAKTASVAASAQAPAAATPVSPRASSQASAVPASTPPADWQVALGQARLDGLRIDVRDLGAGREADLSLRDIRLRAQDLATDGTAPGRIELGARWAPDGVLSIAGPVTIAEPSATLQVDLRGLGLLPLQPYFTDFVTARVSRGALSAKGQLAVALPAKGPLKLSWRGGASVDDFKAIDKDDEETLLRWRSLSAGPIAFDLQPLKVDVAEVKLADFYSLLQIDPQGRFNLQDVVAPDGKAKRAESAAATDARRPADAPAKVPATSGPPPDVRIGRIVLDNGRIDFQDHFVKPNYSADLVGMSGTLRDLSPTGDGALDLRGRIEQGGNVQVAGNFNPLASTTKLKIEAAATDIDLPRLSPYSAKYVGYGIEKGKLSARVRYELVDRTLTAENNIVLDQLTFGEKVDSPDALKLPVLFAVSLLKDRNGVIDVNLPISGSLDDPQFSVGGIVLRIIGNLIVKAVAAPFSFIANLVGGSADALAAVPFAAGDDTPGPQADDTLAKLAKALEQRPGLRVDLAGRADRTKDAAALRERALDEKLAELRAGGAKGPIDAAEREALIARAWREWPAAKAARAAMTAAPTPAQMHDGLLAGIVIGDAELRDLANARAVALKDRLVEKHGIEGTRVFLVAPRLDDEALADATDEGKAARVDDAKSRVDIVLR